MTFSTQVIELLAFGLAFLVIALWSLKGQRRTPRESLAWLLYSFETKLSCLLAVIFLASFVEHLLGF